MRDVDNAVIQAVLDGKPSIKLLHLSFAQGSMYLTNAPFDFVNPIDGQTYLGNGLLLEISDVTRSSSLVNVKKTIKLSGVSDTIKSIVLSQSQVNREVIEYIAYLEDDFSLIGSPYIEWQGIINKIKSKGDKKNPIVIIDTGTIFEDFDRRVNRTTTMASQQRHFPNDLGMQYASETNKEIKWGIE